MSLAIFVIFIVFKILKLLITLFTKNYCFRAQEQGQFFANAFGNAYESDKIVGAQLKNKLNNLKNCIFNVYNNIIRHLRSSFDRA